MRIIVCERCGRENPGDARFCAGCGAPLGAAPEAAREERKVVTVLFADLVGFTSRAERLDPEDVRAVLEPYHAQLRAELERHGGTVEKFIGDAVMALFGAPTAHEDDPERAVRAAFAIRDWVVEQEELQLRIGITTGEALVRLGARPSEGEGMASGDVVNAAARLQSAAPVNGILVDETTYRATAPALSYREHEAVTAKGKAAPIPVWEAVEARSRPGVDVSRGTGGPLVGREKEVDLLRDALTRTRQEQSPQLVTLVGVPGIGKSRLVSELLTHVEADPDLISWRQGRCLPYGEGVTYWALSEMVKAEAGILETDAEDEVGRKLNATVSGVLALADAARVEAHLRPLVGLADEAPGGGDRRADAFAAWRHFFEALAERRPLVLVFEDLHWAGENLLEFVDHLIDWAGGVPMLVVCTARPELLALRPGWGGGKANAATISLSPLSDEETAKLVHALLERAVLPADVQSTLIDHAGGNPLYAEEFARMFAELGPARDGETKLPESVQGIIAARLDGLPVAEKLLLQDAAVVGKVFWLGAVARVGNRERAEAEQCLHALERKEFVRRERRSSVGDESEYAFRHLLVRDVAYSQIPRAGRADKHRAAAEWIESLGRAEDHAETIAHHYLQALELAAAAGRELPGVAERARRALRSAGDRAIALGSFAAAARLYGTALELWPAGDPDRPYMQLGYGRALSDGEAMGDEPLAEASAALEAGDPQAAAEAEILLADNSWRHGHHAESVLHQKRAAALVAGAEESRRKAFVFANLARYRMLEYEFDDALRYGEEALAMAERLGAEELRGPLLNTLGSIRGSVGNPRGLDEIDEGVALMRSRAPTELARALNNRAHQLVHLGRLDELEATVEELVAVAEGAGSMDSIRWGRDKQLSVAYLRGRWDEAWSMSTALVDELEAGLSHYLGGPWRMMKARIQLARGDRAGAVEGARRGLADSREAADPQILVPLLVWNARLAAGDEGSLLFDEFLELWSRMRSSVIGPPATLPDAAAAAVALGRERDFEEAAAATRGAEPWVSACLAYADHDFTRAADLFGEIGTVPDEAHARLCAAQQAIEGGRPAAGEPELERALVLWRSLGATAYVREAEALLAASA